MLNALEKSHIKNACVIRLLLSLFLDGMVHPEYRAVGTKNVYLS